LLAVATAFVALDHTFQEPFMVVRTWDIAVQVVFATVLVMLWLAQATFVLGTGVSRRSGATAAAALLLAVMGVSALVWSMLDYIGAIAN